MGEPATAVLDPDDGLSPPVRDPSSAEMARVQLTFLLQLAYSGELAATRAYLGHRQSLKQRSERAEVGRITREEIQHRHGLLAMLHSLGAEPDVRRERKMNAVGRVISTFCQLGGWFFPMYGAAKLEAQNVREYELAARLAFTAGLTDMVEPLLEMAEVEWDHELYFRSKAMQHRLWRVMPKWPLPPARTAIRASFADFQSLAAWQIPVVRPALLVR